MASGGIARRCLVLAAVSCCSLGAALALVVFGNGATWERELPLCTSERSACSLVHRRYWQSPLEIRLCRCPRKEPCPEGFDRATDGLAFNVTARTQLKMCSGWQAPPCNASQVSLVAKTVRKISRVAHGQNGKQTHAEVMCRCSGQNSDVYYRRAHGNNTADLTHYEQRQYFTCESDAKRWPLFPHLFQGRNITSFTEYKEHANKHEKTQTGSRIQPFRVPC
ncbi:uncharacterized protein LOC142563689 isoform X2 [Dermacentor variabilis]|uniref:uncharacterized protein LOC142563689 isoform X2 n=1 Tax=Dermacentor variabilis TaxID=34621 RepID=UPI003F5AF241